MNRSHSRTKFFRKVSTQTKESSNELEPAPSYLKQSATAAVAPFSKRVTIIGAVALLAIAPVGSEMFIRLSLKPRSVIIFDE
jgi:hypothetical protein